MRIALNVILWLLLGAGVAQAADNRESVEAARQAALDANAALLASGLLADGEEALARATRFSAEGSADKAAEELATARWNFAAAELQAIQTRVLGEAREAISAARSVRAKRYAPRTLDRAVSLAEAAAGRLADDRTDIETATNLADEAAATARLATRIVETARRKPTTEDLLLEQAGALWQLQEAAGIPQLADQAPATATTELAATIRRLASDNERLGTELEESRKFAAALEEEIRILDARLGGASAERKELVRQLEAQARKREQLLQAQGLFADDEATVFQQSDRIIARLTGLSFPSGSAQLGSDSDPLFARIATLITIWPDAVITVEGHTDARGSDRLNLRLSENRARTVMERLIRDNAALITRITSVGYGETRPIANNETAEGREQNRRIDLVIVPVD